MSFRFDTALRLIPRILALVALGLTSCSHTYRAGQSQNEMRTSQAFLSFESQGPLSLRAFLYQFPKGADLHVHLSGAVYAETFIRDAGEDGLCVDTVGMKFAKPPCHGKSEPAKNFSGVLSAADQNTYDRLVDAFSMRSFVPTTAFSGHDQFFATFDRFGGLDKSHLGEWVDELASRSPAQNQQYLELMETPTFGHAADRPRDRLNSDLAKFRQQLFDHGLRDEVAADRESVRTAEAARKHVGTLRHGPSDGGPALLKFATFTRFCVDLLRSRFSRKHCLVLKRHRPAWMRTMILSGYQLCAA